MRTSLQFDKYFLKVILDYFYSTFICIGPRYQNFNFISQMAFTDFIRQQIFLICILYIIIQQQRSVKKMNLHRSPKKNSSFRSASRIKTEASPRKSIPTHTLLKLDKLKVFIKFRPNSQNNHKIKFINQKQIEIERQVSNKIYNFDHVYHHHISSQDVFETGCKDTIDEVLCKGGNGLIFVYGFTGTGKTHTMGLLGQLNKKSQGIVPQSLNYIYSHRVQNVSVSFSQIYMDQVYDMLDFELQKKLVIRENQNTKQPYLQNQINISVKSIEEAFQLINIGLEKRKIAEQKMNRRSSRGHGVITLNIKYEGKVGKLCFVDLAGSQRIKQSESVGKTLNEAVHINASLSALQTLLMNISQQSVRMYRGNKLTRLLQPFMESGKIRLFVTSNYENIQPIQFAKRCKGIKFMEREVQTKESKSNIKRKEQSSNSNGEKYNKSLIYCISNMLSLICKINQNISELLEDLSVKSNFSLVDSFQIKNAAIQSQINAKIKKYENMQERIIEKEDQKPSFSPQQLITLVDSPADFMKNIHDVGFSIFQSIKQMCNLTEYRNVYKKQIFKTQLKSTLLENKNKQFQGVINHLLKSHTSSNQNKLAKELKEMGVEIRTGNMKKKKSQIVSKSNIRLNSEKDDSWRTPTKQDIENSPMNRSHRKSLIYIEDA